MRAVAVELHVYGVADSTDGDITHVVIFDAAQRRQIDDGARHVLLGNRQPVAVNVAEF